ncbi:hypothetical protein RF11_04386 [Thelohanellus kitauei]|uniref:Uncharacterized protein n=1 Tax=Thelohanellus kitauei TaxID=669202 RepID=A0A0C2J9F3_THEKT|nr:hypothetical protein RF11_04386 [Thelohanellus kitauei]
MEYVGSWSIFMLIFVCFTVPVLVGALMYSRGESNETQVENTGNKESTEKTESIQATAPRLEEEGQDSLNTFESSNFMENDDPQSEPVKFLRRSSLPVEPTTKILKEFGKPYA